MKMIKTNRLGLLELRTALQKRPWSILSWSSGIAAITFILYFGLQVPTNPQVGAQFVLAEWPDPKYSPYFFAKPITWFSYFSFLYWAFGLEAQKQRLMNLSQRTRRFLFIATAFIAFGAFYEVFFNFTLWSALMSVTNVLEGACTGTTSQPCPGPDVLANSFPALRDPINLVFATKLVTAVFALSLYSLWFLHRLEKETERRYPPSDLR